MISSVALISCLICLLLLATIPPLRNLAYIFLFVLILLAIFIFLNTVLACQSARYKELKEDKRYIPEDWEGIPVNRETYSGHSKFKMGEQYKWTEVLEEYTKIGNQLYHQCVADLEPVLGRKRAKESARFFKTYNSQIEADVQFNFRSL